MLLSESVTTFLVAFAIIAGVMALKSERIVYWFIVGAGFGLASLSRPEYILFPFFLTGFIFLRQRHEIRGAVKASAFLVCGLVLVIAPWSLRNYMTYKQFIPTSVGAMGLNLFTGTYENEDWQSWGKYPDRIFKSAEMKKEITAWQGKLAYHLKRGTIGLKEYDLRFKALALDTIKENPLNCLTVWIKRLPRLWYQNYIQMYVYREPSGIWFIIYFLFSILALILMKPKIRVACTPIFLLFLYMNLVYLPFHIEPRYGVTIYPGLSVLSAIGLWLSGAKLWGRFYLMQSKPGQNNNRILHKQDAESSRRYNMTSGLRTIIVIPCYNEEKRLAGDELLTFSNQTADIDFLLVNDGSTDGTMKLIDELDRKRPDKIKTLHLTANQGKGEAVRQGLLKALEGKYGIVGYWDADLSAPLSEILRLRQVLVKHQALDAVIGSRVKLIGRSIDRQTWRHYTGRIIATLISMALRLPVYDTQCGAKLFRASAKLKELLMEPFRPAGFLMSKY